MSTLVPYASKHGASQEIAERIAGTLMAAGQEAEARSVKYAGDLASYNAFVIGSASVSSLEGLTLVTNTVRTDGIATFDPPRGAPSVG